MPFHAFAVGRAVVDVFLHALLNLVLMDRERDIGALGALARQQSSAMRMMVRYEVQVT